MKKLLLLLRDQVFRVKLATLLIALVAVLAVMMTTALTLTSTPVFCGLCHEMSADHASWQQSDHKNVTCVACHIPPNVVGFVEHKMAALPELYMHVANDYEQPINKEGKTGEELPTESCEVCHTMGNRVVSPQPGLKIDHKVHLDKKINCATCHNRVAHPGVADHEDNMKMQGCFRCHGLQEKARAPGRCDTCHTNDFNLKPASHNAWSWLHADNNRRAEHGREAKQDRKYCLMCHQESFCTNCHGVGIQMPHPADTWAKGPALHSKIGKQNPAVCAHCHTQQDFCQACHHKGYDASKGTWVKVHRYQVDAKGAAPCFDCHGPTFCAYCHVEGKKPASIKGPE
ncbi:MAG: NapC/NirT family cytochrome c [Chloroflexi bacterium]|nr:NapC/NirT family cytochrome c [Chloroflexota bacterium]